MEALAWFTLTVLLALGTHFFVTFPLLLRFVGRIRPYAYYGRIMPAQLMAFSTASSSATLPVTLSSANRAGISEGTTSFVLPLGATVNMDGTALFECVVVIFIAQAFGADLTVVDQFLVVLLALLTSIGVAGIPAASLVAITLILTVLGLPLEAIGLYIAVDRILDMCRTSVNVTGDLTVTRPCSPHRGRGIAVGARRRGGRRGVRGIASRRTSFVDGVERHRQDSRHRTPDARGPAGGHAAAALADPGRIVDRRRRCAATRNSGGVRRGDVPGAFGGLRDQRHRRPEGGWAC